MGAGNLPPHLGGQRAAQQRSGKTTLAGPEIKPCMGASCAHTRYICHIPWFPINNTHVFLSEVMHFVRCLQFMLFLCCRACSNNVCVSVCVIPIRRHKNWRTWMPLACDSRWKAKRPRTQGPHPAQQEPSKVEPLAHLTTQPRQQKSGSWCRKTWRWCQQFSSLSALRCWN
jgi:hypothetical protein